MKRAAAVLLAGLAGLAGAAPAGAARPGTVLATVDRATPIAAYGGWVAWSARDPASDPARPRFRLVLREPTGVIRTPQVAARRIPFDVDLGPDRAGRPVAVYSRCPRERGELDVYAGLYTRQRGCDLFRLDIATGRESRLPASSPHASEVWPTFWRGAYAFARAYAHRPAFPYLYVRRGGRTRRVPGGQRRACGDGGCSSRRRSAPQALELQGRRLTFAWRYAGLEETPAYDVRVHGAGGRSRRIADRFPGGGLTAIVPSWPAFVRGGRVQWARACFGDPSGCVGPRDGLFSARYGGARRTRRAFPPGTGVLLSHDRAAGVTYLLVDRTLVGDCEGDPPNPAGTCALVALEEG